jgi:hypothetical protein
VLGEGLVDALLFDVTVRLGLGAGEEHQQR